MHIYRERQRQTERERVCKPGIKPSRVPTKIINFKKEKAKMKGKEIKQSTN